MKTPKQEPQPPQKKRSKEAQTETKKREGLGEAFKNRKEGNVR